MRKLLIGVAAAMSVSLALWLGLGGTAGAHTPRAPAHHANTTAVSGAAQAHLTGASQSSGTSTESENSGGSEGESGSEPPGEPVPGHEDPQGVDVNHDCSPENPSGCDTANGELP